MAPRTGLPKPDRSKPGRWLPITRAQQPAAFRQREEQEAAGSRIRTGGERLGRESVDDAAAADALATAVDEESRSSADALLDEMEGVTDNESDPPSDALAVDDQGWKVDQPKSQPLTFYIPSDAHGGVKAKTLRYNIDFSSKQAVEKANKARRQDILRANTKFNLPLKRASTKGREFTEENDEWIAGAYDAFAAGNGGRRISAALLAERYNVRFPGEERTAASLDSRVTRVPELKAKRDGYSLR